MVCLGELGRFNQDQKEEETRKGLLGSDREGEGWDKAYLIFIRLAGIRCRRLGYAQ